MFWYKLYSVLDLLFKEKNSQLIKRSQAFL